MFNHFLFSSAWIQLHLFLRLVEFKMPGFTHYRSCLLVPQASIIPALNNKSSFKQTFIPDIDIYCSHSDQKISASVTCKGIKNTFPELWYSWICLSSWVWVARISLCFVFFQQFMYSLKYQGLWSSQIMSHSIKYGSEFSPIPELSSIFNLQFKIDIQKRSNWKWVPLRKYQASEDRALLMLHRTSKANLQN